MRDSLQQASALPGRGRRSARRPRTDYTTLLAGLRDQENESPNPGTPDAAGGRRRKLVGRQEPAAAAAAGVAPPAAMLEIEEQAVEQSLAAAGPAAVPAAAPPADSLRPAKRQRGAAAAAVAALAQAVEADAATDDDEAGAAADDEGAASTAGEAGHAGAASQRTAVAGTLAQRQRKLRQRVLVDVHSGAGPGAAAAAAAGRGQQLEPEHVENEYERQRLERIRRNEQMLRQLGIAEAAGGLAAAVAAEQRQQHTHSSVAGPAGERSSRAPSRPRERRPALPAAAVPVRKSKRQQGERALAPEEAVAAAATELGPGGVPDLSGASDKELEHGALLELEQYFELIGQDISGAVHSDGRFRGWVNPAVCERYGIPPDPDAAWEAGGGGKFSFKIDKKAIPSGLKGRGWSDARAFSHTQLIKNPNAYFYRHVVPHEQQAQGEWTEEEHQLFVETARAHGVGDKWGLFASYLPQRVGYQCSAYYRDVIIPQGLVIDKRFKMTRNGKAVFVGC